MMGSLSPFLRAVHFHLLTPVLLMGALAACGGPEPVNVPQTSASEYTQPLVTAQPAQERDWLVAPDDGVSWMLAPDANLQVLVADSADPIAEGTNFNYRVDILNLGPDPANNVQVTVNIPPPAVVSYPSTLPENWFCSNPSAGFYQCSTFVAFAVNAPVNIIFATRAPNQDDVLLQASATINSTTNDPTPGNNSDSEETVVGMNDTPAISGPAGVQTAPEDVEIVFSTANGNRIAVADPDAFNRRIRMVMDITGGAARGTMTLSRTTGLDFSGGRGDGTADAAMQFDGTLADINAALDGMRFTPAPNYYGTTGLVFSVLDLGNSGLGGAKQGSRIVQINVTPEVNDPPNAVDDTFAVPGDSVNYALDVLANDTWLPDPPETLTITAVTQPANGTVSFTATGVTFTPTPGFRGTTTFTYTISDPDGATDTATVTCTVGSPNNPPTANNDSYNVVEDNSGTNLFVLANDSIAPDTGEQLTITGVTQPSGGTVTFTTGNVRFTPTLNFFGPTTFTYTISDGRGGTATATVTVNVTAVNDPPTATHDTFPVVEDTPTTLDVLANDSSAPDGPEALTITAVTQPANGSVSITGGTLRFTPAPEFNGTVTFTYTLSDGNGGTATATVTVNVTPVNDPPVATADAFSVAEDSAATPLNVLANDSTAPETGETLSITAVTQPAGGAVTFAASNVSFTPTGNFFGPTTFTYTLSDGNGGTAVGTVTVNVTAVNDPPDAVNDAVSVGANSGANVLDVLANDTHLPDAPETLTITAVTQSANGTVAFTASNVTFTPAAGFRGNTSFTYTISDPAGATDTATVTVTVGNNPPVANADSYTVDEDSGITPFTVLANDSIAPDTGETLSIIAVTPPANGSVTFVTNEARFRPASNFHGTTTFTYTVSDGNGGTATATVTVTVRPVNDPPDAVNDSHSVDRNSPPSVIEVLANDTTAPDTGETLTITTVSQPLNGTVTFTATNVSFTPALNFVGTTTFTYTVNDGNGGMDTGTVTVTVRQVNAPPTAVNDAFSVAEDSPVSTFLVLANDTIAPDTDETLTVTGVTQPASGTVSFNASNVRFTPAANFNGVTTFTYTISDGNGGTSTATVTVTVTPVNDPPDAVNDGYTVAEGSSNTSMDVLANDSMAPDSDDTLTISSVTQPASGTVTFTASNVSFTPAAGFSGNTTFTYTIADGNGGSDTALVTVAVTPVNDPPTANDDTFAVVEDSAATTFSVLTNDTTAPDTGETLTITAVTQPANGTVSFTATNVSFTPTPNFFGTTTFTYTVTDGNNGFDTATVTVTVDPLNDAPTAVNDALSVAEDSGATVVSVLANDSFAPDLGETLTVTAVTQPATGGSVSLTGGVVRFTPASNFNGTVTFTYTIADNNGGTATATVTITVTPVNDPPQANNDSFIVAEDSGAMLFDVLANDSTAGDVGETLTVTAVTQPANGTVTFTATGVSFTPALDFNGITTFTYTISDGNNGSSTATVTVRVTPVNENPTANDDSFEVAEDSSATALNVLANDTTAPDTDETLTISGVTQPGNGTATFTATEVRFTPTANFHGTTAFAYTVTDGNGGSATAIVTVTVTSVNDSPTATDDSFEVAEDSTATVFNVLANDSIAPDTGETLTVTSVTQPANGTATFTASNVSFEPANNFAGTTTFTYRISDGRGGTATAQVTVTVTPVNDPPDAVNDTLTVAEDSSATVLNVLTNDTTAPEGSETLTVTAITQPANGTVSFTATNVSFTPALNFHGTTTFTYTVSDGNGGNDTAQVMVTVTPVNDAPDAVNDSYTVAENSGPTELDVLLNDTISPDTGETLTITTVTQPSSGTVSFSGTHVRFTPAPGFVNTVSFTYTISDGNGGTDTATVTVNVSNTNDPPTANDDAFAVDEDSLATPLDVLANDSSAPDTGETLTVTAVTQPANGTVTLVGGVVSFAPAAHFFGTTSFTYTLSDGNQGTDTAVVTVTVRPVNDPPTAANDSFVVGEDSSATVFNVLANDTTTPEDTETLTITSVTQPANGTVAFTGVNVSFTPAANFAGTTTFTYTISDGNGGTATATVTVSVTAVNDPPDAVNDSFVVAEGSTATPLDVLANDTSAPDSGETLTVTAVTQPANGSVTLSGGVVRFTPPPGFHGTVVFSYTLTDSNSGTDTATVTVTVTPLNDPPTASDDNFSVAEDSVEAVLDVLANDSIAPDTGETLSVTAVTQPANGTVTFSAANVIFTPTANFHGTTTFTYTVSDSNDSTDTAQVTVTVTPVNDAPTANGDSFTVAEDSGATVLNVLANDSIAPDTGETLTITSVTQPSGGTVTFTAGDVSFTPALNFFGDTSFTYRISDGNGGTASAMVNINVTTHNDAPTASDDSFTVAEDSGTTALDVLFNDSSLPDEGETLTVTAVTQPANGTVIFTATGVSFTPVPNFFGDTSFTYTITDGNGSTDTATVLVTVTPMNDAPTANNDNFQVAADSSANLLDVLANDTIVPDVSETLIITSVTQPASGSVTSTGSNVRFTPSPGFAGVTTFTYRISDGNGGTSQATVTVLVGSPNRPPMANDDSYTVAEDSGATVLSVLLNDSSAPDEGETLTITAVTQPANGTVTFTASSLSFVPAPNYFGTTAFTYTVSDGNGGSDTAQVTVTVTPVNDVPTANNDSFTVAEDSLSTVLDLLSNDTIVPDTGETLTVAAVTQPANGAVSHSGGTVRFLPAPNFHGTTTFTYTISDGNGGTATATVTVTVTPVNDRPDAVDDTLLVAEDSGATPVTVLANDSFAPDTGETLTVTAVSQPATGGSVTLVDGAVSFTPAPNFFGRTSFTYTISDGNGGADTATVAVTVTPVNDAPNANDDSYSVAVNSPATPLDVLFNDTAAPDTGETLTVTAVTQPATGGAVALADGVVRFTPAAGFIGPTMFTYTISDGSVLTDTATVTVTVTGSNRNPVANDDSYEVDEDSGPSVFSVLDNDTFAPDVGETLTITAVTQPANGTVTFTAANVTFTPAADFNGTTTFSYQVSDGNGGSDTATVTVTVRPVPDCDAVDDSVSVAEDSGATALDVGSNDRCENLSITAVTQPASGTVTLSGGVVRFTPLANFNGTTSFTYTISGGGSVTDTATVTVTVTPVNDPPNAVDDTVAMREDDPFTNVVVLPNDTAAPDTGETLTITSVTQPANGTVTLADGLVSFRPTPNFFGVTTFMYVISDGNGGTDSATVTLNVMPVNDPPAANDDRFTVPVNSSATRLSVLVNDTFLPDAPETLTVTQVTQPANGSVTLSDGEVRFTPVEDFSGTTTFTYTISDGNGGEDTGTVTVVVQGTNHPPTASDDRFTVAEDSSDTVLEVLSNDTAEPDTDETLTVVSVTQPANGTVTLTGGVVRFTPALNFHGTTTFTYTISDGNDGTGAAQVTVTVTPVNDPPNAVDDSYTVAMNSPARVLNVLANDTGAPDTGETLTVTEVTQPASGGTVTLAGGVVSFTPAAGFTGTVTFTYTISDGTLTDTATVVVTVSETPNNPPTARDDSYSVDRNSPATVLEVLANDTSDPDLGETLTVTAVTQPASGGTVTLTAGVVRFQPTTGFTGTVTFTYTISDGNGGTATANVTVVVIDRNTPPTARNDSFEVAEDSGTTSLDVLANDSTAPDVGETLTVTEVTQPIAGGEVVLNAGVVEFTPALNYFGTVAFTYTVSDGTATATATVLVAVTPVNDPPTAVDDSYSVARNSAATVLDVLDNDTSSPDREETLTVTAVTQPTTGGTVTLVDGVVSFTPAADFTGTVTFTYTLSDGTLTDTATVTVRVGGNNPPVAVDDSITVDEDSGATTVTVLANDTSAPDTGETLTVTAVTQPATGGTVTLVDGVVSFTPAQDFDDITTFTYTISDGNGGTATATVTVTVTPINDPPTGVADAFTIEMNSPPQTLDVLANDSSAPEDETLTVSAVTQPASGGTVLIAPDSRAVVFTPALGFTGTVDFTYTVSDGNGGTAIVNVTVTVRPDTDTDDDGISDAIEVATGTNPNDDDSDDDGLMDGTEDANRNGSVDQGETNPRDFDSDDDQLSDGLERGLATPEGGDTNPGTFRPDRDPTTRTDPLKSDTDEGGVLDGIEDRNHNGRVDPRELNPLDPRDDVDADGDGVDNALEEEIALDPFDNDSDDDGVTDGVDGVTDTDGDGAINALDPDSDGDGLLDGTERSVVVTAVPSGTNTTSANFRADADPATNTNPLVTDTDADQLGDGEEDRNHNGLVDERETDPNKSDTDGDELSDGVEVKGENPTDPLLSDTDSDGLGDGAEDKNHDGVFDANETDPNDPDTDKGGASDGVEVEHNGNPLDDSDDFVVVGSGCASTGEPMSLAPLLLLLGLPLLRRRRVAAEATVASRSRVWGMLGVLAVLVAAPAKAQPTSSPTSTQIDVQQFKPGPGAYDVLGLHSAKVNRHLGWNLGLSVNYAKDPLTFLDPREDEVVYKLVENQFTVDVMAAIAFLDRFELGLVLPITSQTSQSSPNLAPLFDEGVGKTGLGDVRLVPKASLYSAGGLSLGAALPLHLPTGGSENFLGGGLSVRPRLLGEWNSSSGMRVLANLGMNLRSKQQLRNLVVSNELAYGLGAEVPFKVGGRELSAGGTLMGALGLGQKGAEEKPLELLAMVKYRVSDAIAAQLGGGPGLSQGYGTPGFRVFAGLAYVAPISKAEPKPEPKLAPVSEVKTQVEVIAPPPKPTCALGPEDKDGFQDEDNCADPDNDSDGVLDAADKCTNEPETKNGFEEEDGCPDVLPPPPDTDGDGLVDPSDLCPQAAEDKDGFQDEDGCPDVDNDRDGVADADDKCPKEPETINGVKDEDGCPDKGKVKVLVEGEKIVILDKVFFANNKATILPTSFPLLRQVAQVIKANPQLELIRVEGHTDDKGEDGANLVLSRSRAEAVRDRLIMEGIDAGRLEAVGYGEAKPIAPNKTNKGREQNRRVEFTIVKVKPKEVEIEQH
jgi:outer membrane protein OmpA-like peptidoglycan-associated protein